MRYHSTRGDVKGKTFRDVVLSGYASDGGMLLPETYPQVSQETLRKWAALSFEELAYEVCSLYVTEEDIPADHFKNILHQSFSTFSIPEVVRLSDLKDDLTVVELFHGRSLAFKDLAMSNMGHFYKYYLTQSQKHMNLLVCTSGDTGSAAIEAVRGMKEVDVYVLMPRGRITNIQERMMTSVLDSNVHCYRGDGSSDDLDIVVKDLFDDVDFVEKYNLASPSSLNFARILIQLVHFFYTYLKLCPSADKEVELILPTGGGGNVTGGIICKKMGLPVRFVCAVNHNNMLSRMMDSGHTKLGDIDITLAPAMDIQFAYNFERVWFLCSNGDSEAIKKIMKGVYEGKVEIPDSIMKEMKSIISVYTVADDAEIQASIRRCWQENQYTICPHTAVGVAYFYHKLSKGCKDNKLSAVLATASPLKFPDAISSSDVPAPTSQKIEAVLAAPVRHIDMEKGDDWTGIIKQKILDVTSKLCA